MIGDYSRFWLHGMTIHTSNQLAPKIPVSTCRTCNAAEAYVMRFILLYDRNLCTASTS